MSTHLPLADVPFRDLVAERIGLPVFVDNDANVAMLAEWRFGAARGASDAALLTIGTGIGGGLVVGGALQRGSQGAGAELGHMVVQADGPRCNGNCPNRGCLEAVCSGTALAREARRLAGERPGSGLGEALAAGREITGPLVTDLAHDGDAAAIEAVAVIGRWLGIGVANLVNMLNPEVVVIGGGVIAAGDLLLEPARAVVAERALSPSREHVRIVPARFGAESGMLGAATLAFDGLGVRSSSAWPPKSSLTGHLLAGSRSDSPPDDGEVVAGHLLAGSRSDSPPDDGEALRLGVRARMPGLSSLVPFGGMRLAR